MTLFESWLPLPCLALLLAVKNLGPNLIAKHKADKRGGHIPVRSRSSGPSQDLQRRGGREGRPRSLSLWSENIKEF